jgi:hypothetical protein
MVMRVASTPALAPIIAAVILRIIIVGGAVRVFDLEHVDLRANVLSVVSVRFSVKVVETCRRRSRHRGLLAGNVVARNDDFRACRLVEAYGADMSSFSA